MLKRRFLAFSLVALTACTAQQSSNDTAADEDALLEQSNEWVRRASLCGQGDAESCDIANKLVEQNPEVTADRCSNGDPLMELCGPVREAQEKGLLGGSERSRFVHLPSNEERCKENPSSSACLAVNNEGELQSPSEYSESIEELAQEVRHLDKVCADAGGGVSGSPDCDTAIALEEKLKADGYCIDYQQDEALIRC